LKAFLGNVPYYRSPGFWQLSPCSAVTNGLNN
jgi:hypothetical protein